MLLLAQDTQRAAPAYIGANVNFSPYQKNTSFANPIWGGGGGGGKPTQNMMTVQYIIINFFHNHNVMTLFYLKF